ncbi:hypothetical protein F4819DRAFT_459932, partial [Hypoxylon fuscum]
MESPIMENPLVGGPNMGTPVPRPVCDCYRPAKRREGVVRPPLGGRRPTRSGKCRTCGIAKHREGQLLGEVPAHLEHVYEPYTNIRGYHDDNIWPRLQIVRIYTQLKMEGSPLLEPNRQFELDLLPKEDLDRLRVTMNTHLG